MTQLMKKLRPRDEMGLAKCSGRAQTRTQVVWCQPASLQTELVCCFSRAWQFSPEGPPDPPGYELERAHGTRDALIKDSFASSLNWL